MLLKVVCAAETQSEKRALACALKRIIPVRLAWTVGRKQFNSTVLAFFFGQKFVDCVLKWRMEFPLMLIIKVIEEIIDVSRSQSSFVTT